MTDYRENLRRPSVCAFAAVVSAGAIFSSSAAIAAQQGVDLEACAAIEENAERLACFDAVMAGRNSAADENETAAEPVINAEADAPAPIARTAAEPAAAPAPPSDDYVVLPRAEAEELRRRAAADERAVKRESYESKIVRVFKTGYNTRNVELENGEIWREMKDAVGTKPRRGEIARLAPASLGSWTIQYGGRSAKFKTKRTK